MGIMAECNRSVDGFWKNQRKESRGSFGPVAFLKPFGHEIDGSWPGAAIVALQPENMVVIGAWDNLCRLWQTGKSNLTLDVILQEQNVTSGLEKGFGIALGATLFGEACAEIRCG